jgi:hypothetical protein
VSAAEAFTYHNTPTPTSHIVVNRLDNPDQIERDHAVHMLTLLSTVYYKNVEDPSGQVTKDYFRVHFDPQTNAVIDIRLGKMQKDIREGHQILYSKLPGSLLWAGAIQVRPEWQSGSRGEDDASPDLLIDNFLVDSLDQGWGQALMYSAVRAYESDRKVLAHVVEPRIAKWFTELGMERIKVMDKPLEVGRVALQQVLHSTGENGVALVRNRLVESAPWLTNTPDTPAPPKAA